MHSNVLFLSATCVEVRPSRSWNEATSRRRTSQMLRLIPLRHGKVWNRRYHVSISTMWFCTCTEYRAQYYYMSHDLVRFIHSNSRYCRNGIATWEWISFPSASFTKVDRCCTSQSWAFALSCACRLSLRHPETFCWDGFYGMWVHVSVLLVTFKWFGCSICSRLHWGRQLYRTIGEWKKVLHWADKAMSWVCDWSSLKIPCKLLPMKRWSCFGMVWNIPLGSCWSFTMIRGRHRWDEFQEAWLNVVFVVGCLFNPLLSWLVGTALVFHLFLTKLQLLPVMHVW